MGGVTLEFDARRTRRGVGWDGDSPRKVPRWPLESRMVRIKSDRSRASELPYVYVVQSSFCVNSGMTLESAFSQVQRDDVM